MALISLLGLFLGAYLTLYKFGVIGTLACGVSSCEKVQTSRWSVFLGLPVATWGLGLLRADARAGDRGHAGAVRRFARTVAGDGGARRLGRAVHRRGSTISRRSSSTRGANGVSVRPAMVLVLFVLAALDYREAIGERRLKTSICGRKRETSAEKRVALRLSGLASRGTSVAYARLIVRCCRLRALASVVQPKLRADPRRLRPPAFSSRARLRYGTRSWPSTTSVRVATVLASGSGIAISRM